MNDLFEGVTSWIAETYDGLCSEIGAGIQEKDASRVMVNALLVVGFTGGMSAVVVGVCALAAYFWEWLIIPAIIVAFVIHHVKKGKSIISNPDTEVEILTIDQDADEVHEDLTMCVCSALIDVSDNTPVRRPRDPQSIQTSRESQWRIEGGIAYHQFEVDTSNPLNAGVIAQFQEDLQKKVNRYAKAYPLLLRNGHAPFVYAVKNGGNYLLVEVVLQTERALPRIEQRRRELIKRRQRMADADDRDF